MNNNFIHDQSGNENQEIVFPKRSFFDYQYEDGPDYNISFDHISKQPLMNEMDPVAMG